MPTSTSPSGSSGFSSTTLWRELKTALLGKPTITPFADGLRSRHGTPRRVFPTFFEFPASRSVVAAGRVQIGIVQLLLNEIATFGALQIKSPTDCRVRRHGGAGRLFDEPFFAKAFGIFTTFVTNNCLHSSSLWVSASSYTIAAMPV